MNQHAGQLSSAQIIVARDLDQVLYDKWLNFFECNPDLDSPYFHPEFTKCVANVRNDIEIAVFRDGDENITGFFPFQRVSDGFGQAIGGRMNDFAGIISRNQLTSNPKWLLDQLDLNRFDFHALVTQDQSLAPYVFEQLPSYYIDLSGEWSDYLSFVRKNSSTIKRLPQKIRALRRDVGDLSFEFESKDVNALEQLIELKRNKFINTNTFDILSVDWAANLLRQVHGSNRDGFRGILSVLRAGDNLVAAHFGMISGNVLHYWFPVYAPQYAKYSPGLQLMLETCKTAHRFGIKKIDMSYGESSFKDKFCNQTSSVNYGSIMFNPVKHYLAKQRYFTRLRLKQIPMKDTLKVLLRKVFPEYGKWHFK